MNNAKWELAERLRDRELTTRQLLASSGDAMRTEKCEAQIARIDARIAELRAALAAGLEEAP